MMLGCIHTHLAFAHLLNCLVFAKSDVKKMKRGIWSEDEHEQFLEAIQLYPRGPWHLVSKYVGTRSCRQVQTHAQKYFEKVDRHQRGLQRERKGLFRKGYFRTGHRIVYPNKHNTNVAHSDLKFEDAAVVVDSDARRIVNEAHLTAESTPMIKPKGRSDSNDSILCSAELPSLEETLAVLLEYLNEDENS